MATPNQSFDYKVQLVAGATEMHALKISAAVLSGQTFNAGSIVSLNSDGKIIKGCPDDSMPLFAINGTSDLDVTRDDGIMGGGNVNCYVATGGFELFTSEFKDETYAINDRLTPGVTSEAGLLKVAAASEYNDNLVCGIVSRGVVADKYNKDVLYFWPMCIPPVSITVPTT